jgi:VanZ family protein
MNRNYSLNKDMKEITVTRTNMRLRRYLVAGYILLIVYGSLSPFSGWRTPSAGFLEILTAPLGRTYSRFDLVINLFAYLPFGLLLSLMLRPRVGTVKGVILATLGGLLLSAAMEYAQMYLPRRTSSNLDLMTNTTGTMIGAILAATIAPLSWFAFLMGWRQRLFHSSDETDFGLALIVLWMFAQVNPSLPMLGNAFIDNIPSYSSATLHFGWLAGTAAALNLLMLGSLLITLLRQRRHIIVGLLLVLCMVALVKFIIATLLLKSWALLLWINDEAIFGLFAGLLLLTFARRLPQRWLLLCTSGVSLCYFCLAHILLASNTSSMSLYQWHYGHLLNYNNLSQLILAVFPFLLLIYLWRIRNQQSTAL